ncbi:hypothetical protein PAEPH01_1415 [Pancytospora epiphaga]|nr:hypothetical protein PAEPH01_1415 [Pancytospora epiphaga]
MEPVDEIRVFLESPLSLDPVDPEALKTSESIIKNYNGQRQRKKKRKERLPPYVPFKSIYEQTDLSKLTERQRRMVMKFQDNKERVSNLFLEVHGIYLQTPASIERKMNREKKMKISLDTCRTKAHRKENCARNNIDGEGDDQQIAKPDCDKVIEVISDLNVRLPFCVRLTCKCCREDAIDLLKYTNWIIMRNSNAKSPLVAEFRSMFALLIGKVECICTYESIIYDIALAIAEEDKQM